MTDLITTQENAAANLPQLEIEIKFYLGQTAHNIIEVGKRLIQAKSLVQHGQWQAWSEKNFQLSYQTTAKFIQCAEKFSNVVSIRGLNSTQMIALLSLPNAEETEKFIAEKAAEGKRIDEMTIKQLREEIAGYKKQLDAAHENYQQSLFDLGEENKATVKKLKYAHKQALGERDELIADLEQELRDRPTVTPEDYQTTKDALIAANGGRLVVRAGAGRAESVLANALQPDLAAT